MNIYFKKDYLIKRQHRSKKGYVHTIFYPKLLNGRVRISIYKETKDDEQSHSGEFVNYYVIL